MHLRKYWNGIPYIFCAQTSYKNQENTALYICNDGGRGGEREREKTDECVREREKP